MSQKIISACQFYQPIGRDALFTAPRIMMATTKIFNYDILANNDVKIRNEQLNAVARDYLRGFLKQL
jgi:hypothetical protein